MNELGSRERFLTRLERLVNERELCHGFAAQGSVDDAWDRGRGIDIEARPGGGRYAIEAKAETGTSGAQQENYFLGMLGELLQRIDDEDAHYGIAARQPSVSRPRGPVATAGKTSNRAQWLLSTRDSDDGLVVRHEV